MVYSVGMQRWYAALVCSVGMQRRYAALVCSIGMQHWYAALVCPLPKSGWATTTTATAATEEFSQSIQAPSSTHPGISYPVRASPSLGLSPYRVSSHHHKGSGKPMVTIESIYIIAPIRVYQ